MKRVSLLDAGGLVVDLRAGAPFGAVLADRLADLALPGKPARSTDRVRLDVGEGADGLWTLAVDRAVLVTCGDAERALEQTLRWLTNAAAAHAAPTDTVFQAAVMEDAGRVIALTESTGRRLSTVGPWWAGQGGRYVAESVCALRPDGTVRSFRRPIALREATASDLGVEVPDGPFRQVFPWRVSEAEARSAPRPAQDDGTRSLDLIVAVRSAGTGAPVTVTPIDPARALVHLAANMVGVQGHRRAMFRRLEALVRQVPVIEVTAPDHQTAHEALMASIDGAVRA